jgi:ribose-phosphate pyrophosphokinase
MDRNSNCLVFSLRSSPHLTQEVVDALGMELAPCQISHFSDGESFAKPLCDVAGKHCFILHSTFAPVSTRLVDLFIFVDALKRAGASKITAIMPYYGYARQDRIVNPGDPISGLLTANLLKCAGLDEVVTMDFHSPKLLAQFPLEVTPLSSLPLLAKRLQSDLVDSKTPNESICVVSPDHGGVERAQYFASFFPGSTFAYAQKSRPQPNKAEVHAIVGEVKDKLCVIVDDMIDTAGTLAEVTKALYAGGAKDVCALACHGIFSGHAYEFIKNCGIHRVVVTNSIERDENVYEVVSLAPVIVDYLKKAMASCK